MNIFYFEEENIRHIEALHSLKMFPYVNMLSAGLIAVDRQFSLTIVSHKLLTKVVLEDCRDCFFLHLAIIDVNFIFIIFLLLNVCQLSLT